jgi:ribonuclease HI
MKAINIYSDGACRGNQSTKNLGGYGDVLEYGDHIAELKHAEKDTTNNRMEISAVIAGLSAIKEDSKAPINLYSDSVYVIDCIRKRWFVKWRQNGWKTSDKTEVKNIDLWEKLIPLATSKPINYFIVKGHVSTKNARSLSTNHAKFNEKNGSSITMAEFKYIAEMNNRADELANIAMDEFAPKGE